MTAQPRRGNWMQTATGRQFWPLDPRPEEIHIEDIAHALSMQCRYGGHALRFYSVGEHSVLLSRAVSRENALLALLHDAPEAYVQDVIRPIKPHLTGYHEIEARIMRAICDRFGLPYEMPAEVKDADNRILLDEQAQNMAPPPVPWGIEGPPLGVTLGFWPPDMARVIFLNTFRELTEGRA